MFDQCSASKDASGFTGVHAGNETETESLESREQQIYIG